MKKYILAAVVVSMSGFCSSLKAQDDITSIFKSGIADLNKVAEGYLIPAGNAFASGMGSGWYNTADTHPFSGFDLRLGLNVTQAPVSDRFFSLAGLENLKPGNPSVSQAPSFTGKGDGVQLSLMQPRYLSDGVTANPLYKNGAGVITTFTSPGGISDLVPSASLQLTVGLPFSNDLMVRFVPTVKRNGGEASLWGVGVKNKFKDFIPVFSLLPFDASVLVAYNVLDIRYAFPASAQVTPEDLVGGDLGYIPDPQSNDYTTQGIRMSASALTANLIVSKKFLLLTPYVGFGITRTSFDLKLTGNYPTLGDPVYQGGTTYKMQIRNVTNPIHLASNLSMPGATVGLKLNLVVAALNAQYTFQKYPTASVGFALGFR